MDAVADVADGAETSTYAVAGPGRHAHSSTMKLLIVVGE